MKASEKDWLPFWNRPEWNKKIEIRKKQEEQNPLTVINADDIVLVLHKSHSSNLKSVIIKLLILINKTVLRILN